MLIQIRLVAFCAVQNSTNSRKYPGRSVICRVIVQ